MTSKDRFLVTGCASGIGRRVADELAGRGHRVLATDIDIESLRSHAEDQGWPSERVHCQRLDVTDPDSWTDAVNETEDRWGGLDVLYNIAGYLQPGYVHEVALADVDRHFDINVKGVVFGTRIAAARMVTRGSGHIINIASLAAFAPVPGIALYSASKYAVRAFSLAAATELRDRGVAVTVVCPDAVETPMLGKQRDYDEAALTFTAPRVLSVDEVMRCITGVVLEQRPLEVALPRSRKWLARIVDVFPELGPWVSPLLAKRGRAKQRKSSRD